MHHEALLRAKTALVTVPCLTYRLEGFFVLDTDVSNHATGTLFNKFRWERNCNLLYKSCSYEISEKILHSKKRAFSYDEIMSTVWTLSVKQTIYGTN